LRVSTLDGGVLQGQLGMHPLQLGVLLFQLLQSAEFRHRGAAVFRLPVVEGRPADPVLPEQLGDRHAGLGLLQGRHDLRLREP
jgi:hypothetical protein